MNVNTNKKPLAIALSMALLTVSQAGFADTLGHTPTQPGLITSSNPVTDGKVIDGQRVVGEGSGYFVYHGRVQNSSFTQGSQLLLSGLYDSSTTAHIVADNANSENNNFQDNSHAIIKYGHSAGDSFTDTAAQFLGHPDSDENIEKSTAVRGSFNKGAYQVLESDSSASESHFNDHSAQWLTDNASSISNEFSGESSQILVPTTKTGSGINPSSISDHFKDASKQYATNAGQIDNASFTDQAGQELIGNATSRESNFSAHSTQSVGSGAKSIKDKFTDNAIQTIHNGGVATGTNFSSSSALILEDGGESGNATFNDNASGMVANNARMSGTTTLNNGSVLTAVAGDRLPDENIHVDPTTNQIENIVINNGARLNIMAASNGSSVNNDVTTGSIIMNGGTIQFGHESGTDHYSTLFADSVTGTGGNLIMNGNLANHHSDVLSTGTMSGWYALTLNNQDSGSEIANDDDLHKLIQIDDDKGAVFTLNTPDKETGKPTPNKPDNHGTDQGTHKVTVVTKKDPNTGKTIVGLITDTSKTSNSTDAVMGLASATQYIFDGEMQALRTRRGDIQRFDQSEGGVWGRYLHNSSDIKAGAGADYRLGQNGMELGGDKVFDVADGKLSVGAITSYSKSSVKQRGDSSQVSSYGVGLYSSYLSSLGYYIDGVVKFNHFNNDLHTRTDRGQAVKGSYDQNGYGAALEAGYQYTLGNGINIDPYVRANYFAAQAKDIELSNGMKAAIGSQKSAKGELGVSVGKAFEVRSVTLSPYITAAVEHEFLKDNKVTFNDRYTYKNDQSGTLGKFGAGLTAQVTKNAQVYVEADYRKGKKVESPIIGNAGFRINF
ncbi:autotransporter outer membrane beta-barrel domain-containing protein [Rahnella bonaserana]|jgi:outer membrane autotransporter protein|uniref:autotransporter outer membrane beta-barrel domain-containing protein n=1 Tax=Rahnella bonaserana TaxID=2816248 RepID=UPI00320A319D